MSEKARARRQKSAMNSTSRYRDCTPKENVDNPEADRQVMQAIRECSKVLKTVDPKHRHRVVAGLRATLNVSERRP